VKLVQLQCIYSVSVDLVVVFVAAVVVSVRVVMANDKGGEQVVPVI
jgi:hypothetical protein